MTMKERIVDLLCSAFVALTSRILNVMAFARGRLPRTAKMLSDRELVIYRRHYHHPFITREDLRLPAGTSRLLPGIRLDPSKQLAFLKSLSAAPELRSDAKGRSLPVGGWYGPGDADVFYGLIRNLKPRRIIEIGCGESTEIARLAIERNSAEDATYACHHQCVEPYEQPQLEKLGVDVIRKRAELCSPEMFTALDANDILFVDSSHVIRPQGDVLFEYLEVLPVLRRGVFIHVHDIFTPTDYPDEWIITLGAAVERAVPTRSVPEHEPGLRDPLGAQLAGQQLQAGCDGDTPEPGPVPRAAERVLDEAGVTTNGDERYRVEQPWSCHSVGE